MGIAEIEAKILEEAEEEAERIREKAEAEVLKIEAEAREKSGKLRQEILLKAKRSAEDLNRAITTPARLNAKKTLLTEKHKIIDGVFAGAELNIREEKLMEVARKLYG
jgi:vacuolar-type H+-ATPase subunit E/Vma4